MEMALLWPCELELLELRRLTLDLPLDLALRVGGGGALGVAAVASVAPLSDF